MTETAEICRQFAAAMHHVFRRSLRNRAVMGAWTVSRVAGIPSALNDEIAEAALAAAWELIESWGSEQASRSHMETLMETDDAALADALVFTSQENRDRLRRLLAG